MHKAIESVSSVVHSSISRRSENLEPALVPQGRRQEKNLCTFNIFRKAIKLRHKFDTLKEGWSVQSAASEWVSRA